MSHKTGKMYHRLAVDTIKDYIVSAESCLNSKDNEGSDSCHGMPCLLLLCSAIDAIGSYYKKDCSKKKNDPNKFVLYDNLDKVRNSPGASLDHYLHFFKLPSVVAQCGTICDGDIIEVYDKYRCLATHNAALGVNYMIVRSNSDGSLLKKDGSILRLSLEKLLNLTNKVYDHFVNEMKVKDPGLKHFPVSLNETGYTTECKVSMISSIKAR